MERGYVKLWRSIDQNELLEYDNAALVVFTKLITRADRMTGSYRTGRYRMAEICNMPPSTVRDALKRLEAATIVRQQHDSKATTIFICNWWKYQQDDDRKTSHQRRADDTKQEKKEKENIKEINKEKSVAKVVSDEYNRLSQAWEESHGRAPSDNKTSRAAVKKLLSEHTIDEIEYAIRGAAYFKGKQYKPQVLSFASMYEKWDNLLGHMDATVAERKSHESNRFE